MKRKMKKFLSAICACTMMLASVSAVDIDTTSEVDPLENITLTQDIAEVAYVTPLNEQAIESKYGLSVDDVNTIAEQETSLFSLSNDNALQFTLRKVEGTESIYSAYGTLNLNGTEDTFQVSGKMYQAELNNGDLCFSGGLSGYLNNDDSSPENSVTLSVNYDSTTGDRFVTASIGSSMVLNFGEAFSETSEIFNKVSSQIEEVQSESIDNSSVNESSATPRSTVMRIGTAMGSWNGYSAAFVSIWGNDTAVYSGSYNIVTKTQGRRPQFVAASKVGLTNTGDAYCIVDTIEHAFVDVWNINNSVNDAVRCSSLLPQQSSQTFSIALQTPWAPVNSIIGNFTPLTVRLRGVQHIYGDNYRKKTTVHAWDTDLTCLNCTTGYSPYNESNGFSSNSNYVNTQNSSFTFYARGEIQMFYGSVRANGDVISTWKTVPSGTVAATFYTA